MNTKVRALLWEELRVGGVIAGFCALVGLLVQLVIQYSTYEGFHNVAWHGVEDYVLTVTLAAPLFTGLLLVLNTANSGNLAGGFSGRVLRLPVETWSAVLVALLTRLIEVLLVGAFLLATCWGIFLHGPGIRAVFILALAFLLIQVLDWTRAVAPLLTAAVIIAVLCVLLGCVGGVHDWAGVLASEESATPAFLVFFIMSVVLAYAASVVLVGWTRSGARFSLLSVPSLDAALSLPVGERRKTFASPMTAQVWSELRRSGLSFPATVLGLWAITLGAQWLVAYSKIVNETRWTQESTPVSHTPEAMWAFEILPFVALLLASFAWHLNWGDRGLKDRPTSFLLRQPMTGARMAQARLISTGVNLGLVLAVIAVAHTISFLWTDHAMFLWIIVKALQSGETDLREVAGVLTGPLLASGLIAWVFMNMWGYIWIIISNPVLATVAIVAVVLDGFTQSEAVFSMIILVPVLLLGAGLFTAWRKGLLSRRSIFACIASWAILTVVLFPFSSVYTSGDVLPLFLVDLAVSALAVSPYVNETLYLCRRGPRETLTAENPDQHRRALPGKNWALRGAGLTLLVAALALIAWIRWPEEPPYKKKWRSEGLPTNLEELNAWYAPVKPEENLADRYIEAANKQQQIESDWWNRSTHENNATNRWDIEESIAIVGKAEVKRADLIPSNVWYWTRRFYEEAARQVCVDLHEIARSGLTASRYPVDLRKGSYKELWRLDKLRQLAGLLALETLVASVERRPDAVIDAIVDTFPIGDSLKEEPILESQRVRISICGIAWRNIVAAVNRVSFSEEELKRIQDALAGAMAPLRKAPFIERGMIGEEVTSVSNMYRWRESLDDGEDSQSTESSPPRRSAGDTLSLMGDMLGFQTFDRIVMVRRFSVLLERLREGKGAQRAPSIESAEPAWSLREFLRAPMSCLSLMSLEASGSPDLRIHTQFGLARTGVAVERFRLAHGRLPQHLDELIPAFLDGVPRDPWNEGRPVSYRIKDNGEFVVYSFSVNLKDDLGEDGQNWVEGDLNFTVATPEVRERPQVAPEGAQSAERGVS